MTVVGVEERADGVSRTTGAQVNLAFRVAGAHNVGDRPAIVLLHGTSANHAVWAPIADTLSAVATVISVDQRGHGLSDKPSDGYDGCSFAADVVTVLDAVGIERAVVAGHSLGARNAWVAAAHYPERVSAVVAIDYTPFVEASVLDTLGIRVAGGDRVFDTVSGIEDYLQARYPRMPLDAVARRARWGYRQLDNGTGWVPLAPASALAQVVDGLRTPWDQEFRDVRVPLTCMRGADSAIVTTAAWEAARDAHPRGRWIVVDDADHYVPEEQPELVIAELSRILDND